jgi:hypothetical protein
MRKSTLYLIVLFIFSGILGALLLVHPMIAASAQDKAMADKRRLVQTLQLTDLCLFTEARYTRHLSQADLYSAFQDHPMSFEHFPSGSLTLPPVLVQRTNYR